MCTQKQNMYQWNVPTHNAVIEENLLDSTATLAKLMLKIFKQHIMYIASLMY